MTGQWEKYVEQAADEIQGHQIGSGYYSLNIGGTDAREMAQAVLAVVGPLIERDTRERLVAAAARAIHREPSPLAITTVEQLQAHADRAAIHGPNAAPAVVLDSQGVPWLICINEDGDTFAQTMPDGPDTPSQHDFEQLLEHSPAGVTPVWPAPNCGGVS